MFDFYGMTSVELGIIHNDYRQLLASPESQTVLIRFAYITDTAEGPPVHHSVYKHDVGVLDTKIVEAPHKCIHKLASEVAADDFIFRFIADGQSIFFMHPDTDLVKPDGIHTAIKDSILLTDQSGRRWALSSNDTNELDKQLGMHVGIERYATIAVCNLMREDT